MEPDEYCREIEAYLCRTNEGNLVRITGPAFDKVRGWATMGVPLKVAFQGIDRHVQRVNAKGPRRRPVRVEFCEADILDAFDAWRRAVGVRSSAVEPAEGESPETPASRARRSLSTHLDRVIVRLTALRTGPAESSEWEAALDQAVRRLDALHASAGTARGAARDAAIAELAAIDAALMEAARHAATLEVAAGLAREADEELEPFRARMTPDTWAAAHQRCVDRLLRDRLSLPTLLIDTP